MFVGDQKPIEKKPRRLFFKHIVRKVFLEDWVMKLIALAITLALWFGVTGLSTPTTRRLSGIPLTLLISNDSEITNAPLREIDLVVSGDKRRVDQINTADLGVSVDLSDTPAGDQVVQLTPQDVSVSLPTGVKLEEIQPSRIAVRLEAVEEKEIPVQIETEGNVSPGSALYDQAAIPANVKVRGPASFIRTLKFVPTDKIDISNRNTDFTAKQIAVSVANPKATVLETVVDVTFNIREGVVRSFRVSAKAGATSRIVSFDVVGPKTLLVKAKPDDFHVEIVKDDSGSDIPNVLPSASLQGSVQIKNVKIS
jgi:hypothetical protein